MAAEIAKTSPKNGFAYAREKRVPCDVMGTCCSEVLSESETRRTPMKLSSQISENL